MNKSLTFSFSSEKIFCCWTIQKGVRKPNHLTIYFLQERNLLTIEIKLPDELRTSVTILLFKKGDKKMPYNCRGINRLFTTLKLMTKIISNKINECISLSGEQQVFRSERFCTDPIFIVRQIMEKSIEFNITAFMCFIDLQKAFDRIQ